MLIHFYKFHGAGNDFVLIDNRESNYNVLSTRQIKFLCDRHFGIGADGLMLLNQHKEYDFEMDYYNSDGFRGFMCGNGGRCIVALAKKLNLINNQTRFLASDGEHTASIDSLGQVKLKMIDVEEISQKPNAHFIFTGAPHHIVYKNNISELNVKALGSEIRNSNEYKPEGTNVNFVEVHNNSISIRTYERGVENETLACGTGAVASAMSYFKKQNIQIPNIKVKTLGGELTVSFTENNNKFTDVYLTGPAQFVFEGQIEV